MTRSHKQLNTLLVMLEHFDYLDTTEKVYASRTAPAVPSAGWSVTWNNSQSVSELHDFNNVKVLGICAALTLEQ